MDVLNVAFPSFEFVFLFDHSNGHDRLQPNGLSLSKINMKHGGRQPIMRSSKLTANEFGPFHNFNYNLQPGLTQHMQYTEEDDGPCYMTIDEKENRKLDEQLGGTKEKNKVKAEFIKLLKESGIANPTGTKKELQDQCRSRGISTVEIIDNVREGWLHKQKGAIQILFERGWLDPQHLHHYTEKGKKEKYEVPSDPTGCNFSIERILAKQADFCNELTLLQYHARKLGALVDRSPKCHPELAGEGIEYLWGLAKL